MSNDTITSLIDRLLTLGVDYQTLNSTIFKTSRRRIDQLSRMSAPDAERVYLTLNQWIWDLEVVGL